MESPTLSTTEAMMEFLFHRKAINLPPIGLAEVFERLIWCMDDNGTEIHQICKKWVKSENEEKVKIVLAMKEIFPADNREELKQLFSKIVTKWPNLKSSCDSILDSWDQTFRNKDNSNG